ncbi:MAG: TIGR03936 family radical SAM-associated protein [Ardenticatenaceae bacterium]|nr:TIGR03936 family radical SAM-associated protein [Ardenticatenaceae bacterium]
MQATYVQRLRVTFRKFGPTRYISHLDVARTWERALNRAKIPMAYSQGFNRRPKMQFATATSLGTTSDCELVDLWLTEMLEPAAAHQQMMSRMAPGIEVTDVREVPLRGDALQTLTRSAVYEATVLETIDAETLAQRAAAMLDAPSLMRERKTKKRVKRYDLRPLIYDLQVTLLESGQPLITMHLALEPSATGRPDEVLKALDLDPLDVRIHRTRLTLADELDPTTVD